MKTNWNWKLWVVIFFSIGVNIPGALAQITSDNTLGASKSVVQPVNSVIDQINGGAIRGVNLFHSFQEFNIREGRSAYFANPIGITNIFSRVTGSNPSQLLGTLGVSGNANLFFMNPNGIIFGSNAKLDISGSFVASTANSVIFPNGMRFSASNPEVPSLLTINVSAPVGLRFESQQSGALVNAGNLGVGQNLTLVGGTVVSTGKLSAPNGALAVVTVPGVQGDGRTPVVNFDEMGQFVNWEMQSASGSNQSIISGVTLPQLLANQDLTNSLTLSGNGEVLLTGSQEPVKTGDIAVRELQAKTAVLASEGNLTLVESKLGTTGNLNLLAQDTVRVRDSITNPFIAASGGQLLVQGNQGVDIFALNHPKSGLFSGRDMVLRSADQVGGDAHYYAGGNFRIEKLDGTLGNLYSPHDPIIRSLGDVSFYNYDGASLHIFAGGKVEIAGEVYIFSPDSLENSINPITTPELANVNLSNGKSLEIDGSKYLTLDIRAGMKPEAVGFPQVIDSSSRFYDSFYPVSPNITLSPTSADIFIAKPIYIAKLIYTDEFSENGIRVFLTNKYKPNTSLPGKISVSSIYIPTTTGSSSVVIDSRDGITINGEVNVSPYTAFLETYLVNSGNATFLAEKDISLAPNSSIKANGLLGGNITLISKGDVSLAKNVEINVRGGGDGNIVINSANLNMSGESVLRAGILRRFGSSSSQAGNIDINVNGVITLDNESSIANVVQTQGMGKGGDVIIQGQSLFLNNSSSIIGSTFGQYADAGNIRINIRDKAFFDGDKNNSFSDGGGIYNDVGNEQTVGNAGNINLIAGVLKLTNGAVIRGNTYGLGNAGNINIKVVDTISLDGVGLDTNSSIQSRVFTQKGGKGGNIDITTGSLFATNGGVISASTFGRGNAGSVTINARDVVSFDGISKNGLVSGVGTREAKDSVGNAGDIKINTAILSLTNGGEVLTTADGIGNAGNIEINATNAVILSGVAPQGFSSALLSGSEEQNSGQANNIKVTTDTLRIADGAVLTARTRSAFSGGNIIIDANTIDIINGGQILTTSFSGGNAGDININAKNRVTIFGSDPSFDTRLAKFGRPTVDPTGSNSGIYANTEKLSGGNGGNIFLNTETFELSDNGVLDAKTAGFGRGGSITVNTKTFNTTNNGKILTTALSSGNAGDINLGQPNNFINKINISGANTGLFANTENLSQGAGGKIKLYTEMLSLNNGAQLAAKTAGEGNAGSVTIEANKTASFDNGNVLSSVESGSKGNGGNLSITTPSLSLKNGSQLQALTRGEGDAGNVTVQAIDSISFDQSFAFTSVESEATGKGGSITVTGREFSLTNGSQLSASTLGKGNTGNIKINTMNGAVSISGSHSGLFTKTESNHGQGGAIAIDTNTFRISENAGLNAATTADSPGGSITVNANTFDAMTGGQLLTTTSGKGRAGDITLNTNNSSFSGANSGLLANTQRGSSGEGGKILVNTTNFQISDSATLNARTEGTGSGGNITVNAEIFNAINDSQITTTTSSSGRAGDITLNTPTLNIANGGKILAPTSGTGQGGTITINSPNMANIGMGVQDFAPILSVETSNAGKAGDIIINTPNLTVSDTARITATATNTATNKDGGGSITLNASKMNLAGTVGIFAETQGEAPAGTLKLNPYNNQSNLDLTLAKGANISASTFASGNGGDLIVIAPQLINISGQGKLAVETTGTGDAGNIQITSPQLTIKDGVEISASTFSSGKGGSIVVNAPEFVSLNNSNLLTQSNNNGVAGTVTIKTPILSLEGSNLSASNQLSSSGDINLQNLNTLEVNNSKISASTVDGKAGSLQINADQTPVNSIKLNQGTFTVKATGTGNSGNLNVNTRILTADKNSEISASTNSGIGGDITLQRLNTLEAIDSNISASTIDGKAGSVNINATKSIRLNGTNTLAVAATGKGSAGNLTVNTSEFNVSDGASVSASNKDGQGGSISVTANNFNANNGGQLQTTTTGSAKAGNIILKVLDNITLTGSNTGLIGNTEVGSTGKGGTIIIDPNIVNIFDGAQIAVNSQGNGIGGDIQLIANTLNLNKGEISAKTRSNTGGNITVTLQDLLLMRNNSQISTTAGDKQFGGNGGNIFITAPFIIGKTTENSDITANAFQGRGGNIQISTQAIFGLNYRPRLTPLSDITASSDFGINGQVVINTPGIDPSRGLTPLPSTPVNTQIVVGCQAGGVQSSVEVFDVGRTGLPSRPEDPLNEETIIVDWIQPDFTVKDTSQITTRIKPLKSQTFINQAPIITPPCYAK